MSTEDELNSEEYMFLDMNGVPFLQYRHAVRIVPKLIAEIRLLKNSVKCSAACQATPSNHNRHTDDCLLRLKRRLGER